MTWRRAKLFITWAAAAALLGYLLLTIPMAELLDALSRGRLAHLSGLVVAGVAASLLADSWSTAKMFTWFVAPVPLRVILPIRAASYLVNILSYHVSQAGLVYFVHRMRSVSLASASAVILIAFGAYLLLIAGMSGSGVLLTDQPAIQQVRWVVVVIYAGAVLYFVILRLRPRWLRERPVLNVLFDAGVLGHLKATASRAPHLFVVVLGHFLALRCFGVLVPVGAGLVLISALILVASVPITPYGLGTSQLASVHLFARYAAGSPRSRQATILAYSLSYTTLALVVQGLVGLLFLRRALRMLHDSRTAGPSQASRGSAPGD